ncbi:OmpH family outer membrane protein [Tunicatimonas pelagia]|uniref:OmpH family outer membrane protein n=1 Tax=Tunicatimonas pelagia TaxID=931531 RepID=UPI0026666BA8|nr:OmpH family outer membrane protein [Tunicatimonas pelagia]WKN44791.1 OmpH family outer membrane protein [Tunicatimonas pelagia]
MAKIVFPGTRIFPIVFITLCALLATPEVFGQKFGYVTTEYILSKMPEYQEAQAEVQQLATQWQSEIQGMQQEVDAMRSELKAEEVLLTAEMRRERNEAIQEKEQMLKEYQQKVFGFEGLHQLKKQELVKPILDQVFEAIEKVSEENKLQIMFDKSADLVMLYTNPIHDYTDYVLDELGLGEREDTIR